MRKIPQVPLDGFDRDFGHVEVVESGDRLQFFAKIEGHFEGPGDPHRPTAISIQQLSGLYVRRDCGTDVRMYVRMYGRSAFQRLSGAGRGWFGGVGTSYGWYARTYVRLYGLL